MSLHLAVKKLDLGITNLGEPHIIDKVYYLLKRRLHHRLAATHDAETQDRALPEILIAAFAD